jgi:general secretion pathway protein G
MMNEFKTRIEDRGSRIEREPDTPAIFDPQSSIFAARGFTLLELVMVMTIIVILAAVGVTAYQHIQLKARETILKEDLRTMRKMIDQYAADKEKLPASLDDLTTAGYIREVPIDPMTGQKDWVVDMGPDTLSRDGGTGVVDVHSAAGGEGGDGAYKDY